MSDTSYGVFQHYGTNAQRLAAVPVPPAAGQPIYVWYETDTGDTFVYHTTWTQLNSVTGTMTPQGRLTLTTALPVTVADVTGATTIYYALYAGNRVPIYDGAVFQQTAFTELSQATTDSTKSPAAVANNSNYDMFVWNDGGTIRCTRGPLWTSDTGRGTGAGTTELERIQGILVNAVAITNGPGENLGTYVGTVRSNGTATIEDSLTHRCVYNWYNGVPRKMAKSDTTSHTYATATIRSWNGDATQFMDLVLGQPQTFPLTYRGDFTPGTDGRITTGGVGIDSTTLINSGCIMDLTAAQRARIGITTSLGDAAGTGPLGIGYHFLNSNENATSAASVTFAAYLMTAMPVM